MKSIRLEGFDLNLLKLFVALAETGSVTAAAARVGLTQPAASNALGRMRRILDDPLFLRSQNAMVPSRYAAEVLPAVQTALSTMIDALNRASSFQPGESRRRFRMSLSGLGEAMFLPALARAVVAEAPFVMLENAPVPLADLGQGLMSGRIDLAIGLVTLADPGVETITLYTERYVAICAPDDPAPPQTPAALKGAALLIAAPAATYAGEIGAILARLGLETNPSLVIREFAALPDLLAGGHYVAIVPARYGEMLARAGRARLLPITLGQAETPVNMVWAAHSMGDAGFRWFRSLVERAIRQPAAPGPDPSATGARGALPAVPPPGDVVPPHGKSRPDPDPDGL